MRITNGKQTSAWGIEIGQAALKVDFAWNTTIIEQVVATAFDYVPHPKILSQPDAIPEELIAQSIENSSHGINSAAIPSESVFLDEMP
ncbi:MAG: hypothetical protein R3C11_25495 [Planctomycetaceae bacterium]